MRDPDGRIRVAEDAIYRDIYNTSTAVDFLRSEAAQGLVENQRLIDFRFISDTELRSPRLPFVSYPHEWCHRQLAQAADLTLSVAEDAFDAGYELKDASAWNVIFDGAEPRFCDHLSFAPIAGDKWRAFGQYVRHFILPLAVSRSLGLPPSMIFLANRDGLDPRMAKSMLGMRRFRSRVWPFLLWSSEADPNINPERSTSKKRLHPRLFDLARWSLDTNRRSSANLPDWADYTETRHHYAGDATAQKYAILEEWLNRQSPAWVVDLGCNTGEFSRLSCKAGAKVVAIDSSHSALERLLDDSGNLPIHAVYAALDDIVGGRGWMAGEFPGLIDRLSALRPTVLALGLVHHLAVASAVPLPEVWQLFSRISGGQLIVELIGEQDPMLRKLAGMHARRAEDFTIEAWLKAMPDHLAVREQREIKGTHRSLYLIERV